MFKLLVIASVVSAAYATRYALVGNDVVEYNDIPTQTISLPYPYQEPKVTRMDQRIDNGYAVRTAVVSQPAVAVVQQETEEVSLSPVGLMCSMIWNAIACIKNTIIYMITSIPALIFGSFSFLGVCNLTSFCKFISSLFNVDSIMDVNQITSFVTPERLKRATEFVETAIKKYASLQK